MERRPEDALAEEAGGVGLVECRLEALVLGPDLAVDVVVADAGTHRVAGDRHALDHHVRVVAQDVAVLERPGLAFVRIADDVLLTGKLPRHEAPLEPRRKARPAAPAQRRLLQFGDDRIGRHVALENLAQRGVAAAPFVVLQAPVVAIQACEDDRIQVAAVEAGLRAHGRSSARATAVRAGGERYAAARITSSASARRAVHRAARCS